MGPYRTPGERPDYPQERPAKRSRYDYFVDSMPGIVFGASMVFCVFSIIFVACTPAQQQNAAHAMTVAEYTTALDRCIALGKVNDSLRVYQACARAVDLQLCNERGVMCSAFADGGADAQ